LIVLRNKIVRSLVIFIFSLILIVFVITKVYANVTYNFVFTSVKGPIGNVDVSKFPTNSVTFTDAAIQSGHAQFGYPNSVPPIEPCTQATLSTCMTNSGFVAGSVGPRGIPSGNASLLSPYTSFSVTFNSDGTLSGVLNLSDANDTSGLQSSGTSGLWKGLFGSDYSNLCTGYIANGHGGGCQITGYWKQVVPVTSNLPCDVAASYGYPCVTAFALYNLYTSSYKGPLFRVERTSDNTTMDIGLVNGFWDSASYTNFCNGTTCYFVRVYDQIAAGGTHLDLINQVESSSWLGLQPPIAGVLQVGSRSIPYFGYDVFNPALVGYLTAGKRAGLSSNGQMPTGSQPITVFMVSGGSNTPNAGTGTGLGGCCYEFGEMENTVTDDGAGTMFSPALDTTGGLTGVDTEDNIAWGSSSSSPIITLMAETDGTSFLTLEEADNGGTLTPLVTPSSRDPYCSGPITMKNAPLSCWQSGPFNLEGGLAAGINGDGTYYQSPSDAFIGGMVISGATSDAANTAIQNSITQYIANNSPVSAPVPSSPAGLNGVPSP
jgi:hypothetical protein